MTARETLAASASADLAAARAQYAECRRKGLRVMTEYYRRQMVRAYLALRRNK